MGAQSALVMKVGTFLARHQHEMGPFPNFDKRTVGHPLQDKGDSVE